MKRVGTTALLTLVLLGGSWVVLRTDVRGQDARRHANRGIALLEQFRFKEAVSEFEEVVRLDPGSLAGHVNLGLAYFNERDFEAALQAFERGLEIDPESPYVHYNLGLVYKLQGRTEEAVRSFERVARIDPGDSMTHYYLGTLYANLGRLEEAERSLRRTLELQPNNESAHFSLGNVLIRQGRREEGQRELMLFRELKESFPAESASAGLQYTELGPYAEAIEEAAEPLQQPVEEPTRDAAIRFVEATRDAGLDLEALDVPAELAETLPAADYDLEWIRARALPPLGSGLAFRDLDGDERPEMVFVRAGAPVLFRNEGGRFDRAQTSGLPSSGAFVGVALGDVDNDGDADVYLSGAGPNALYLNDGEGSFTRASGAGVEGDDVSVSATFADVDHDGDLDIYVANYLSVRAPEGKQTLVLPEDLPGAPNRLYRNNGNGTFDEVSAETRTSGGNRRSLGALFSDLDDDRDIDFVVVNDGAAVSTFSNDRVGTFTESSLRWGLETGPRTRGLDAGDFDRDGTFDLFLTAKGSMLNTLLRGPAREGFRPDVLSPGLLIAGVPNARYGATFLDADHDTDLDLLLVVNEERALAAYYENTPKGFVRALQLSASVSGQGRALAVADVDADGDLDAVVSTHLGELALFRNEGGNARSWLAVRARGLRSNLDGLGAKVEVRAGHASLRREVRSTSGYFSQNDLPLHFGLGDEAAADYVRFLWPGGVKQIEMDVSGGLVADIEELNRKGTSCPILYAWDGEKIRFVTDFLGGSAFGYLLAPGRYNYPDTDESVKIEAFGLEPRDGAYELRFVNQLEEVIIYDEASLLVVDHPEDLHVYPNERLMPGPPYPEERLYVVREPRPPVRVLGHHGRDVTERVRQKDRLYPDAFELLPFKGYAERHELTIELGELRENESYVLLLYGWVDYADSSSNLAASQAGEVLVPPYLEVLDEGGNAEMGIERMGFPAGLPKTMLVDLDGVVSPRKNRVRITTNMRLYWDQILVAAVAEGVAPVTTRLSADEANLRFRGYPAPFDPDGRSPSLYTYDSIRPTALWGAHEGYYTRYGDVRELVESIDDRYVITRHGDELLLRFRADRLPPIRSGWKRTFLAFADGFGKDMDLNSARPHSLSPLPFHGMSSYPYPPDESFPVTEEHRRYNTRYVGPEHRTPFSTKRGRDSRTVQ